MSESCDYPGEEHQHVYGVSGGPLCVLPGAQIQIGEPLGPIELVITEGQIGAQRSPRPLVTLTGCAELDGRDVFVDFEFDREALSLVLDMLKDYGDWAFSTPPCLGVNGREYRRRQKSRARRRR